MVKGIEAGSILLPPGAQFIPHHSSGHEFGLLRIPQLQGGVIIDPTGIASSLQQEMYLPFFGLPEHARVSVRKIYQLGQATTPEQMRSIRLQLQS